MRERLTLYLIFFALGMVAILALLHDAGFQHFMGELHDFFWQLVYGLVKVALMLIVLAAVFAIAYGIVILHRERGVVRPNKYGKAQAIKRWRQDPYLLPQDGEGASRDMELSRLIYQVMQEREKFQVQQYKALESQRRYEEKQQASLPAPGSTPQITVSPDIPEDESVKLSPQYTMHVDEMLSQRGLLVGTSGSGKSSTTAVIAENFIELGVPFLLMDTEGEYLRLPQFMGQGETIDATRLGPEDALDFGRSVAAQHKQVVINLLSYEAEEGAQVMAGALTGARMWEEERANDLRVAVMVFLTEAHKWFPQYVQENQLPLETYTSLCAVFFKDLVRRGRKRGMGLIFDTQKLQEVDKRLIQTDWKVCLRQTEDRSLERYNKWGITNEEAMNLRSGEGFIYSTRVTKLKARMYRRKSPDDSQSPGIASIRNHQPELGELWTPRSSRSSPFDEPLECVRDSSARSTVAQNQQKMRSTRMRELSELQQQEVQRRYSNGEGRKKIQADLRIAADQYGYLCDLCDAIDSMREEQV